MGIFTKDIRSMEDLFLHQLQDIYYAEQQITKALPKMIDKATNRDLAAEVGAGVHRRTGGNPFFVQQVSWLLRSGQDVRVLAPSSGVMRLL